MSVVAVAKKDYQDGMRSKLLWVLIALFVLSIGSFALFTSELEGGDVTGGQAASALAFILAILFLVPITGLVVSIKSITRERELGSLKILLSLPHTRGEVVLGKFLGRSGLLATAILAGFVPGAIISLVRFDSIQSADWVTMIVVSILFGVAFVGVGIGLSALCKTETRATVAGLGMFILLYAWTWIFGYINDQLDLLSGNAELFAQRFYLLTVYSDISSALMDDPFGASAAVPREFAADGTVTVSSQPFYLQYWFGFVILALWIAIPLAIGYWRFENTDL